MLKSLRRHIMMQQVGAVLPDEYQQVTYLENVGNSRIMTGVSYATGDVFGLYLKCKVTTYSVSFNGNPVGATNPVARVCVLFLRSPHNIYVSTGGLDSVLCQSYDNNTDYQINIEGSQIEINGNQYSSIDSVVTGNTLEIPLFVTNASGNVTSEAFYGRIYECILRKNGIDIRHFIPCYRKSDRVAGMYDLVNGVFYTNTGSGSFIVGPDV